MVGPVTAPVTTPDYNAVHLVQQDEGCGNAYLRLARTLSLCATSEQ